MNEHNEHGQQTAAQSTPEHLLSENDPYLSEDDSDDDDPVELFMAKVGNRRRPACQIESVKTFCHSGTLQELRSNSSRLPSNKICLVDDMSNDGPKSIRLGSYKPLTSWEMYHKLKKKKRFHFPIPTGIPTGINIDRRLIFSANPDSYALAGIMVTASESQAVPLADFLYHYSSFRSHIRFANKPPRGYFNFAQQFHLPFYSWRCTREELRDTRRKVDGSPLREVCSMHFIRGKQSEPVREVDYLCEGQLSVLIAAIDRRIWTGYCFVDTYYQPKSQRQTVGDYCKDGTNPDDLQTDPFINGECDADNPIVDAVEYFMTALDSQLGVFLNEWTNTVFQIRKRVQDYVLTNLSQSQPNSTNSFYSQISKFPYSSQKPHSTLSKETQESTVWLRLTRSQLTKLIMSLESTIHCWDNHPAKEKSPTPYEERCLESIEETISDLKGRLFELQNVLRQCDEHERALNLDNIDAQKQVSHLQTTSAISNQTATHFLLHIISPITVAAAMLSMQEKAIPSILGPNKLSFFVLAPILIIFAAAVARLIQSWDRILPALGQWLKRHEVERRRATDIELADL